MPLYRICVSIKISSISFVVSPIIIFPSINTANQTTVAKRDVGIISCRGYFLLSLIVRHISYIENKYNPDNIVKTTQTEINVTVGIISIQLCDDDQENVHLRRVSQKFLLLRFVQFVECIPYLLDRADIKIDIIFKSHSLLDSELPKRREV